MRPLRTVSATPEQMTVIDNDAPGFWLIRGAAGSGKTTTALLRLKFLVTYWRDRREDLGLSRPVRVLVLTFNRTLRGYIDDLARQQIQVGPEVDLNVSTFGSWATGLLGRVVLDHDARDAKLQQLAAGGFSWSSQFLADEVNYVLGRFPRDQLESYIIAERTGRGTAPRVDQASRRQLLDTVIHPYQEWKSQRNLVDWTDLAAELAVTRVGDPYDVVVIDETQDFSANQIRAIVQHLATDFVCTFIRDTTQRIYPNAFTWRDVGVSFPQGQSRRLTTNYRNTREIAAFARPLVEGIETFEDESLPDFTGCVREGPKPIVLRGRFAAQAAWAIEHLQQQILGSDETVAFLHPKGGGWFSELRAQLDRAGVPWTSITREAEWPDGPEQVALSTMHSAKGLEFDHVFLLGYNAQVVQHGHEPGDALLESHRRLLAMAVGRARESVVVGYKPAEASDLVEFLQEGTYEAVDV